MTEKERAKVRDLPPALDAVEEIASRLAAGRPSVFLDYDGTLAPITLDPTDTVLPTASRSAVERLSSICPVAVVSGRDLDDVRRRVEIEGLHYAGSHGFDVVEPEGRRHRKAEEFLPDLVRAAGALEKDLDEIPGAFVERKGFAIAVHFRQLEDPDHASAVEDVVDGVASGEPRLRKTSGKKIFELRPDVDWHKGHAVRMVLEMLEQAVAARARMPPDAPLVPLYVGDDLTDEDAFAAIGSTGVGVVVRGEDDDRETAAQYALGDPTEVETFLVRLADALEGADER